MEASIVVLSPVDNVATTLTPLTAGQTVAVELGDRIVTITLSASVPFGHKFSLAHIAAGAAVIKYGEVIGTATVPIRPGDYVHVHNLISGRGRGDLARSAP